MKKRNTGEVRYDDADGQREALGQLIGDLECLRNTFEWLADEYEMAGNERVGFNDAVQRELEVWVSMCWKIAERCGLGTADASKLIKELYKECQEEVGGEK